MKYLGVDYGSKRVGTAVSDAAGSIAFPREEIPNDARLVERVMKMASDEGAEVIVVGDTRSHGGAENPVTAEADAFVQKLHEKGAHVERALEAWSSIEASRYAPEGHAHDDAAAAAIILQRYLDMRQRAVR